MFSIHDLIDLPAIVARAQSAALVGFTLVTLALAVWRHLALRLSR